MIAPVDSPSICRDGTRKFFGYDEDWASIAHHLRIAAERYDENANLMRNEPGGARLVEQFCGQAAQAREFAAILEGE